MHNRLSSAIFFLLGVLFLDRVAFAEMTLFDFNQVQPSSKRQANSYMTIESYMEGVYGSDISVARGAMAAAGMGNLSSPDTFLVNGKGKNSALVLSFGSSPINSFAVDWDVFRKGTGIIIKADGVVIFQDLLTKSEKRSGVSDHLAPVFFDHPVHTLEFIGLGKSKIGIDNLAVNIPLPGEGSEDPSSGSPFTDSGGGGETGGNKATGFEGAKDKQENGIVIEGKAAIIMAIEGAGNGNDNTGGPYRPESEAQVPEPATFILFGIGLLAIGTFGCEQRNHQRAYRQYVERQSYIQ
jgi:hypothetical protein